MLLVAMIFLFILLDAVAAIAGDLKGSTSVDTYDDLKPKDPQMIQLENSLYGIANNAMAGMTAQLPTQQGMFQNGTGWGSTANPAKVTPNGDQSHIGPTKDDKPNMSHIMGGPTGSQYAGDSMRSTMPGLTGGSGAISFANYDPANPGANYSTGGGSGSSTESTEQATPSDSSAKSPNTLYGGNYRGWVDVGSAEEPNNVWFDGTNTGGGAAPNDNTTTPGTPSTTPSSPQQQMIFDERSGQYLPWSNDTVQGQLFNDALSKQYVANGRYDTLMDQAGQYTDNIDHLLRAAEDAGYNYANEAGTDLNSARGALANQGAMYDLSKGQLAEAERVLGLSEGELGMASGELANANRMLGQAETAGDPWYAQAQDAYNKANGLIDSQVDTLNAGTDVNKWYDDQTRDSIGQTKALLQTGEIPQAIKDAMVGSMTRDIQGSAGSLMQDLAGRGVINSSMADRGFNNIAQNAANAYQDAYSDNFFNMVGSWDKAANTSATAGKSLADSIFNYAGGYGNAAQNATSLGRNLADTGSMKVGDLTKVATGYQNNAAGYQNNASGYQNAATGYQNNATGYNNIAAGYGNQAQGYQNNAQGWNQTGATLADTLLGSAGGYQNLLNSNVNERGQIMDDIPGYWTNAWGPASPVIDYLRGQQTDRANDKQTTVVNQRRGIFS